jgi:hypothetical protein
VLLDGEVVLELLSMLASPEPLDEGFPDLDEALPALDDVEL